MYIVWCHLAVPPTTPCCCCHSFVTRHATPSPSLDPWKCWFLALILSSFFRTSVEQQMTHLTHWPLVPLTSSLPTTYYFPMHCSQILSYLVITSNYSNSKVSALKSTYCMYYLLYFQLTHYSIPLLQFLAQGATQIPWSTTFFTIDQHLPVLSDPFPPCSVYDHMAPLYVNTRENALN